MARVPVLLSLVALLSGILTLSLGIAVGYGAADVTSLLYAGLTTLFLQVFCFAVTAIHARLVAEELAELRAESPAGAREGKSAPGTTGIDLLASSERGDP